MPLNLKSALFQVIAKLGVVEATAIRIKKCYGDPAQIDPSLNREIEIAGKVVLEAVESLNDFASTARPHPKGTKQQLQDSSAAMAAALTSLKSAPNERLAEALIAESQKAMDSLDMVEVPSHKPITTDQIGKAVGLIASIAFMVWAIWYLGSGQVNRAGSQSLSVFHMLFLLFSGPIAFFWVSANDSFKTDLLGGSFIVGGGFAVAFGIVGFVHWIYPHHTDSIPKELVHKWYYNSPTNNDQVVHGGYCDLVEVDGKLKFIGHRQYTWTYDATTDKWNLDSTPMVWSSDALLFIDSNHLMFHYEVNNKGTVVEGLCYGTIHWDPEKNITSIEGRIITNLTNGKELSFGTSVFYPKDLYGINREATTLKPILY